MHVTQDLVSEPFGVVDVYQALLRDLVWLQTCGRKEHLIDRPTLDSTWLTPDQVLIIPCDFINLCKGHTTLIFTVC